jgi:hypothetical protein
VAHNRLPFADFDNLVSFWPKDRALKSNKQKVYEQKLNKRKLHKHVTC